MIESPDKAVSEMPESNVLHVIDVHHLAEGSTLDDFLDLQTKDYKKSSFMNLFSQVLLLVMPSIVQHLK